MLGIILFIPKNSKHLLTQLLTNIKTKMTIKNEIIDSIRQNNRIKGLLSGSFDVHNYTIERWIKENKENGPLTTITALSIIAAELKVKQEKITDPAPKSAAA